MSDVIHISSLLVTAKPAAIEAVCGQIAQMEIATVAHRNEVGKVIVLLETSDESMIVQALTDIQLFDGVVNAALVYHHAETAQEAALPYSHPASKGSAHV